MLITCCLLAADGVLQISGKRKSTSGKMEDKETGKTWVHNLVPDGICSTSGLKVGDVILFVAGHSVSGANNATQLMLDADANRPIIIEFQRPMGSSSSTMLSDNV